MTAAQLKSFVSTVAKRTAVDRALVKQDVRLCEECQKMCLNSVNVQLDRVVTFIPIALDNLDVLAMFREETYTSVFEKIKTLELLDCGGIPWNTVLAIYDSANDVTWFGFNPDIDVLGVAVQDKLSVSPYLPF